MQAMTRDELREKIARELAEILNLDWNLMPSFEDHFSSPTTHEGLRLMANRILALLQPQPKLEWREHDEWGAAYFHIGDLRIGEIRSGQSSRWEVKKATMTEPQAMRVAWTWVNKEYGARVFDGYTDPTTKACINKGFLEYTGEVGASVAGVPCKIYRPSVDGLHALGKFLSEWGGK